MFRFLGRRHGRPSACCLLALLALSVPLPGQTAVRLDRDYGKLPLVFEPNRGQTSPEADYLSLGPGYRLFIPRDGAVFLLSGKGETAPAHAVRMRLLGSAADKPQPGDPLPGKSNYFQGADPAGWVTGVPQFGRLTYPGVYPGIDLHYYGRNGQLEYDFEVRAGADPRAIQLAFEGAAEVRVDEHGDLLVETPAGVLKHHLPLVYQLDGGARRPVAARYVQDGGGVVRFEVTGYDRSRALVIDPLVTFSTLLGGGAQDTAVQLAVDTAGAAYLTGSTTSTNFPVSSGAVQKTSRDICCFDVFVAKIDPSGRSIVYATFLAGTRDDLPYGLAVDSAGNAVVTGQTNSADFPVSANAVQAINASTIVGDAFVTKLSQDGSALVYSTYLGGRSFDSALAVAVDASGNAHVAGVTESLSFPTTLGAMQAAPRDNCCWDGFYSRLSPTGALLYSTFIGGGGNDIVSAIAVDASGIYLAGETASRDIANMSAGAQQGVAGENDGFVIKLNPAGTAQIWATYFGGTGADYVSSLALDGSGNLFLAGATKSIDLRVTAGAAQPRIGGKWDHFHAKLNATGSQVLYSTYLGGSEDDISPTITVNRQGEVYFTGSTDSTALPVTSNALQSRWGGGRDALVGKLSADGKTFQYLSYLGGAERDVGLGIALDASGAVLVAGGTASSTFPVSTGAPQRGLLGESDAFLARFDLAAEAYSLQVVSGNNQSGAPGAILPDPLVVEVRNAANQPAADVLVSFAGENAVVNPGSARSGANGRASTAVRLGSNEGAARVRASVEGAEVTFTLTAGVSAPAPASMRIVSGNNQTGVAGTELAELLVVEVRNAANAAMAGVTVTFSAENARVTPATATTDAGGRASTRATLGSAVGAARVRASVSGLVDLVFTHTATAPAPPKPAITVTSLADITLAALSPDSLGLILGEGLATSTAASAAGLNSLAGSSVVVKDADGGEVAANLLFASPSRIHFVVPFQTRGGLATITVTAADGRRQAGSAPVGNTAPGLFPGDTAGSGVASGYTVTARADGSTKVSPLFRYDEAARRIAAVPIAFETGAQRVTLVLAGSGLRFQRSTAVKVGGVVCEVVSAGGDPANPGQDLLEVVLPASLAGRGEAAVEVTVDGRALNTVTVKFDTAPAP